MTENTKKEQAGFTRDDTIIYTLGKIESNQTSMSNKIDGFVKDAHENYLALDKRVSIVETKQNKGIGAITVVSTILAAIGATLFEQIFHR